MRTARTVSTPFDVKHAEMAQFSWEQSSRVGCRGLLLLAQSGTLPTSADKRSLTGRTDAASGASSAAAAFMDAVVSSMAIGQTAAHRAAPALQTRVASITLNGEWVGMTRSSRKPAAWRRRSILLLGALPAAQQDQHVEVHRLRRARLIVRRDDHLDQQQRARRARARDGSSAAAASPARRPSRGRSASAGAGRPPPAPPRRSRRSPARSAPTSPCAAMALPGRRDDVGQVEQDPPRGGVGPQDRGQQDSVRAPDIHHRPDRGEVVDPHQLARRPGPTGCPSPR